ncbi:MAG: nuclease-related domain-containing protein [Metamycoplasmataceae bacterium]
MEYFNLNLSNFNLEQDWKILVALIIGLSSVVIFLILTLLLFFGKRKKISKNKKIGNEAEEKINKFLSAWALKNNSKYISSSLFKYDNYLFEVDGILISPRSLIIIEVKSINGFIEGDCLEKKWFKILGTKRHEINSPVMQNEKHINHVLNIIGTKIPILSMIIFDDRTENINIKNNPSYVIVSKFSELDNVLSQIDKTLLPKINNNEIHEIYNKLKLCSTNSKKDLEKFEDFFDKN